MSDQLPAPQNLDAEESVLGAAMLSTKAIEAMLVECEPEHFYRSSHGRIFQAVRQMYLRNEPVDPITLCDELERTGLLEDVGGRARVNELAALVPATSNAPHYAKIVREQWARREAQRIGLAVASNIMEGQSADDAIRAAETELIELRGKMSASSSSVVTAQQMARWIADKIEKPLPPEHGIKPPWSWMDRLQRGRLYVLGGYQADGKTAMGIHFGRSAAEDGARVGIVSLEMAWRDLADRMAANAGANATRIARGNLHPNEVPQAMDAAARMHTWKLDVLDDPTADPVSIARWQRLGQYDFLIVDHLHRFSVRPELQRQDYEAIIRALTNITREANVVMLLLAQLSGSGDKKKPFPRPTMASIRESRMVEAEASVVWLIWRIRDERNLVTEKAEFITAKNRFGRVGVKELMFSERSVRFMEIEPNH